MLPLTSVARHRNGCGWSNRFFSSLEHDKVRVDGKSLTGMLMDVDPRLTMHNDIELLSPHQIPSGAYSIFPLDQTHRSWERRKEKSGLYPEFYSPALVLPLVSQ